MSVLTKVLGDPNAREVKRHLERIADINGLEPLLQKLSDDELKAKTPELRERLSNGEPLHELLVEAFAVAREAARRTIGLRPFDVQLVGGIVLHQGKIAEMKTGEGKTLVAVLPLYLNALESKGAHLVTVNDYLARRDAGWNGPIYHQLGMTVAIIGHEMSLLYDPDYLDETHPDPRLQHLRPITRPEAYQADITYGTNSEFGFDYLRDNMAVDLTQCVQRTLNFAIVDEVDSILIDEARTPLGGWSPPGGRGEGGRQGPAGDADDGHHHLPELFPPLQEAGGHDRYRGYRGRGVPQDLRAGSLGHPHSQADGPRGQRRPHLQDGGGEIQGGRRRDRRGGQGGPAGACGHRIGREIGAAVTNAGEARHPARSPQRQAARAGSPDRGECRPAGSRHHRHQHGGARDRHRSR